MDDALWNATHNVMSLVPTEFVWNVDNETSFDTEEFKGWYMVTIINHFLDMHDRGELNLYQKTRFRKALLVSHEIDCISRRERFGV